ncbi:undecaprenyl/decaprenyl-phosphate alpha-N-acetylglucosaminyl 1-phosphate transferase [Streptomyces mutabilis]|uniref:MraY family glycosyltransferase n=1 Tax=Streptomyces mutabilis TaxID=67332 RepID=UPI0022BA5CCE|nr:MraY family glycosyltransferase [Streptomyces mutabilis]MCZ9350996.1 undecaprenyl/decaprenyl-phosphate alpha-N-acetylglucosaminyl 1-phosphate transferase [Streptomyces mutabilis]
MLDDRLELTALVKLGAQLLAAGLMAWQGVTLLWLPIPGVGNVVLSSPLNIIVTVTVLLVSINAVNFIDGLDGLAAGVTGIAGAAFFLYCYRLWFGYGMEAAAPAAMLSAITVGLCLGFLIHNAHPARIFMGDSKSMLLGLLLAGACISFLGEVDPDSLARQLGGERSAVYASTPLYLAVLLPAAIIALPLADLTMAVVRRMLRGQSPFAADREHFHHRLRDRSLSEPRVTSSLVRHEVAAAAGAWACCRARCRGGIKCRRCGRFWRRGRRPQPRRWRTSKPSWNGCGRLWRRRKRCTGAG